MADNDSGVSGFGWFLAGLGIGALVGVLYAPKSGKETRDDLVASALDARDKAQGYYAQGTEVVGQYVDKSKEVAGQYVDKGKEYYDKGRTQWTGISSTRSRPAADARVDKPSRLPWMRVNRLTCRRRTIPRSLNRIVQARGAGVCAGPFPCVRWCSRSILE